MQETFCIVEEATTIRGYNSYGTFSFWV